jgi:hypothetical protein
MNHSEAAGEAISDADRVFNRLDEIATYRSGPESPLDLPL